MFKVLVILFMIKLYARKHVCKIIFSSEFSDILDKTGSVSRRRIQVIVKRLAFHANAMMSLDCSNDEYK